MLDTLKLLVYLIRKDMKNFTVKKGVYEDILKNSLEKGEKGNQNEL